MVSIAFTNGIGKAFVSIINLKRKLTAPFVRQDEGGCGFVVRRSHCLFHKEAFPNTEVVFLKNNPGLGDETIKMKNNL